MTSSYILKQYLQSNFYSVSSLCRLFNLSQKELSNWIKNNIYPDFKTRFNCLRKLDTSELKEEITIKDKDGFEYNYVLQLTEQLNAENEIRIANSIVPSIIYSHGANGELIEMFE